MSDTPTEPVSVNLITLPSRLSEQRVLRKTPAECTSETLNLAINTPHIAHTTPITQRIATLEVEVAHLKSEVAEMKGTLVQMQQVQTCHNKIFPAFKLYLG